jgi:DNA polymerase-3 subunit alpha
MAANLTRNKDDIGEVTKFMDECRNLGMNVLGPDVNESELTFTVNAEGNIRFGLGGVKGVGEGAVLAIVAEREKGGKFKDLFDFIERVNLTSCNKKTIESLALSGAFDAFPGVRREQLFVDNSKGEPVLEAVIRYGNKYQYDKAVSSNSLFGDDDSAIEIAKPEIPYAPEWSPLQKLNKERELIGIYLSAHPLDEYELEIKHLCNTTTLELKELDLIKGRAVRIGGMVSAIRHGMSKAGNPYGILTLEDYDGVHEFPLFGNQYVEFSKYMIKDLYLSVNGFVQEKGADFKWRKEESDSGIPKGLEFKIQHIELLNKIRERSINKLTLSIDLSNLTEAVSAEISEMVFQNKGNVNLYIQVVDESVTPKDKIKLFARQHRFELNNNVYKWLKRCEKEELISFSMG